MGTGRVTSQSPSPRISRSLFALSRCSFPMLRFLGAPRNPPQPVGPPKLPPLPPQILPPVGAATVTPGLAPDKKICPRCQTHVNVSDVTCFFCGYKFTEETKPPP